MPQPRPLAFVGPSISAAEVAEIFPGCETRGPIRNGDLYEERENGRSEIIIIDGLFWQTLAVSIREVCDVAQDGARVLGASSMGALRAADCWPAGVRGVGVIFRAFRLGVFPRSDDEVAVTVGGIAENNRSLSIPLVNVRYSVWRLRRARSLSREEARLLITTAESMHYAQRAWRSIVRVALGSSRLNLAEKLSVFDLKRADARSALALARRLHETSPLVPSAGRARVFARSAETREAGPDLYMGMDPTDAMEGLAQWLIATGRGIRYAPLLQPPGADPLVLRDIESSSLLAARRLRQERDLLPLSFARLATDRFAFVRRLTAALEYHDELGPELMRWHAERRAIEGARRLGLRATEVDRHFASEQIVANFAARSWSELTRSAAGQRLRAELEQGREGLALARRFRQAALSGSVSLAEEPAVSR